MNPVDYLKEYGGWGFWEKTWSRWSGPYETEQMANKALVAYLNFLEYNTEPNIVILPFRNF